MLLCLLQVDNLLAETGSLVIEGSINKTLGMPLDGLCTVLRRTSQKAVGKRGMQPRMVDEHFGLE